MSFTQILNVSISASTLALAVMAVRLLLKKAPQWLLCSLWALVAIRLICPISFESRLSLQPTREVIPQRYLQMEPADTTFSGQPSLELVTNPIYDAPVTIELEPTVDRLQTWDLFSTLLWISGMTAMGIYAAYSYLSLRLRLRMAAWVCGRVWECDELDSPFILGLFRPRIYLPSALDEQTRAHVLAHEHAHLTRLDHLWKPLGYVLLTVHWFNPILWLGYVLLCRDIELACDEHVVKTLDKSRVAAYSDALIRCSVPHRTIALCPLAFGEVGVKNRIKAILHYKKPSFWGILIAVLLSIILAVGFLTDPAAEPESIGTQSIDLLLRQDGCLVTETERRELDVMFYIDWLPSACFSPEGYTFREGELTLYESDTTFLDLVQVTPVGDQLRFDFRFRYHLPESGTALLPCQINIKGVHYHLLLSGAVHDFSRDYTSGINLEQPRDSLEFSLFLDLTLVENADDYLSVTLQNLYETTYVPTEMRLQGYEYYVTEALYRDPEHTISGTPAYASAYLIGQDLHLTALEQCPRWEIHRDMGALTSVKLTADTFDDLFLNGYAARALREENKRAWLCREQELSHILLQQEDDALYLAVLREDETLISNLYRLEQGGSFDRTPGIRKQTYPLSEIEAFDVPSFTLSTDGTFHLTQSSISSYFGIGRYEYSERNLVLKSKDGLYTWVFVPDGLGFRFDAAASSPFHYLSTPTELLPLPDGAHFGSAKGASPSADTLESHLNAAILDYNLSPEDAGLICVENHEILGELCADGVYTGDSTPRKTVTVYLAGEYRTYNENLVHQRFERFCAAITLELSDRGCTVVDYRQAAQDTTSGGIFPAHILTLYSERRDIIRSNCSRENRYAAQLLWYRAQGLETDIDTLLSTICSSPAQSSNPGDYIAAHREEFDRLVSLGTITLRHCFAEFARGHQIGLKGHIMALACREIIPEDSGAHDFSYETCMTGQDWFDQFSAIARHHRSILRPEKFEEQHPYCFLALQALGA